MLFGYKNGRISFGEVLLFLFGVAMVSVVIGSLFRLGYWFVRRMWRKIGGDSELAELIARILLGAFAVVFAFAIAFAVASSLAGEVVDAGTVISPYWAASPSRWPSPSPLPSRASGPSPSPWCWSP